jgi:hypothetical protein
MRQHLPDQHNRLGIVLFNPFNQSCFIYIVIDQAPLVDSHVLARVLFPQVATHGLEGRYLSLHSRPGGADMQGRKSQRQRFGQHLRHRAVGGLGHVLCLAVNVVGKG